MTFRELLKRIFSEEKPSEIEEIRLSKLPQMLASKLENKKEKQENLKSEILLKTSRFCKDIETQIKAINSVDLEKRKDYDKIKAIVKDNIKQYIQMLDKLVSDLKSLETEEPEESISRAYNIILNFNKQSANVLERGRILVGETLVHADEIVQSLAKSIDSIFNESKKISEEILLILGIQSFFADFEDAKKLQKEAEENLLLLEKDKAETEEKIKQLEKNLENFKSSEEYLESIKEKGLLEQEKKALEQEILNIKQKIDLRGMAKHFHEDEKKSRILKKYSDSFKSALEQDSNLEIITLIEEFQSLDVSSLSDLRLHLNKPEEYNNEAEKKLAALGEDLASAKSQLSDIQNEKDFEKNKIGKLNERKSQLLDNIEKGSKSFLSSLNLSLKMEDI